jgi:arylsulfatase A-like enzyme
MLDTMPSGSTGPVQVEIWVYDEPEYGEIPARYREEVVYADRHLGELLEALDQAGLYESSLVILTADHGEALSEHGHVGHARSLYQEELHVPLLIKLPADDPRSGLLKQWTEAPIGLPDLAPTLLDVLGLPALPGARGLSLLEGVRPLIFSETHPPESPQELYAVRSGNFKSIYSPAAPAFELYDLAADPT